MVSIRFALFILVTFFDSSAAMAKSMFTFSPTFLYSSPLFDYRKFVLRTVSGMEVVSNLIYIPTDGISSSDPANSIAADSKEESVCFQMISSL